MALIKCTECGEEISSDAVSCPNCGSPSKGTKKRGGTFLGKLKRTFFYLLPLIVLIYLPGCEDTDNTEVQVSEENTEKASEPLTDDETPPAPVEPLTENEMLTVLKEMFATPSIGTTWSESNNVCFTDTAPEAIAAGYAYSCQARTVKFIPSRKEGDLGVAYDIPLAEKLNKELLNEAVKKLEHITQIGESLDGQTLPLLGSMLEVGYAFSDDRTLRATIQASVDRGENLFKNIKSAEDAIMKIYSDQELIIRQENKDYSMNDLRAFRNALGTDEIFYQYHIVTMTFGCKAYFFDHRKIDVAFDSPEYDYYKSAINELDIVGVSSSPFGYFFPMADFEFYKNDNQNAKTCTLVTLAERIVESTSFDEADEIKLNVLIIKLDPKLPVLRSSSDWN